MMESRSMFSFSEWTEPSCWAESRIGAKRSTQGQISVSRRASVPAGRMKGMGGSPGTPRGCAPGYRQRRGAACPPGRGTQRKGRFRSLAILFHGLPQGIQAAGHVPLIHRLEADRGGAALVIPLNFAERAGRRIIFFIISSPAQVFSIL